MTRSTTPGADGSYKAAVSSFLHNIYQRYALLGGTNALSSFETLDGSALVVLYDDMKLAFNDLMSQSLEAQVPDTVYIQSTTQIL